MNKTIDNETLLLKVESFEHRIEVLDNTPAQPRRY